MGKYILEKQIVNLARPKNVIVRNGWMARMQFEFDLLIIGRGKFPKNRLCGAVKRTESEFGCGH
jgi:hypothetical protein